MSSILERIGNIVSSFQQRYEEYKRPRIPVNLLKSKETILVKSEPVSNLPESNTPKPTVSIDGNQLGEFFRP